MRKTRTSVALLIAVTGLLSVGVGTSVASSHAKHARTATKVSLILNFTAGGPQAGFMYAKARGFYRKAGLDVNIEQGEGSATTAELIASGKADFGIADAVSASEVISKGGAEKIVAPILQTNAYSIMSLTKSGIRSVKNLVGKKVAVQPGTAQTTLLTPLLKTNGVSPSSVNTESIAPAALVGSLLQGQVDAILAGADDQGVELTDEGADINQLYYSKLGLGTVGLSVVANTKYLRSHGNVVSRFLLASFKGWQAARHHVGAAAQAVTNQFPQGANTSAFRQQLKIDLGVLCVKGAKGIGMPPRSTWNKTYRIMTKFLGLTTIRPITYYYTNKYLPRQPVACR